MSFQNWSFVIMAPLELLEEAELELTALLELVEVTLTALLELVEVTLAALLELVEIALAPRLELVPLLELAAPLERVPMELLASELAPPLTLFELVEALLVAPLAPPVPPAPSVASSEPPPHPYEAGTTSTSGISLRNRSFMGSVLSGCPRHCASKLPKSGALPL